jgi:hypothetical protein
MNKLIMLLLLHPIYLFSQISFDREIVSVIDTSIKYQVKNNFILSLQYSIQENEKDNTTVYKLMFFDSVNKIIQTINDTTEYLGEYKREATNDELDFQILDVNFDGFNDFRIKNVVGVNLVPNFKYYLYNAIKKKFTYSQPFSELCCNLSINSKLKEIYLNEYRWQEEKFTKRIYKVVDNEPLLNGIVTDYVFTENNKQKYRTITERLINGEMVIVSDTTVWK